MSVFFQPSDQQETIFDWVRDDEGHALVQARAGSGKCLGRDTPVMMFDGTIRPVQDIVPDDLLMGPDSRPRRVLNVSIGKGPLYRIQPVKGDAFVCNDVHVMSLAGTSRYKGQIIDIPLNEYLASYRTIRADKNWKLFRVPVEFEAKFQEYDPYFVGIWIGDGSRHQRCEITLAESKRLLITYLGTFAVNEGYDFKETPDTRNGAITTDIQVKRGNRRGPKYSHHLGRWIKRTLLNENGEKTIPDEFLRGSTTQRLQLLAGICDTDGYVAHGSLQLSTVSANLKNQYLFLCRSLGFAAYLTDKIINGTVYYILSISGHLDRIPCLRLKFEKRKQIKDVLKTGWEAHSIGVGDFYGFTLDGDGRFLLGDFTVTHNTTLLLEAIRYMYGDVAMVAFNRKIADELKYRLKQKTKSTHYRAGTFHSFGMSAWKRYRPASQMEGGDSGIWKSDIIFNDLHMDPSFPCRKYLRSLVAMAKRYGLGAIKDTSFAEWQWLEDHFNLTENEFVDDSGNCSYNAELRAYQKYHPKATDLDFRKSLYEKADQFLEYGKIIASKVFDFDDMIYMPLADRACRVWRYDWVLVDEGQDSSPVRRAFARLMLKDGGRTLWVADRRQAIYGFNGADSESVDHILNDFTPIKEFPLTTTYRCAKNIVRYAQSWTPDITFREDAPEGEIFTIDEEWLFEQDLDCSDVIICRNNAPLIALALKILREGIGCKVEGRDIGQGLMKLANRWKRVKSVGILAERLGEYRTAQIKLLTKKNQLLQAEAVADSVDSLLAIIESMPSYASLLDLDKKIKGMFGDSEAGDGPQKILTLSTIHKFKGKEADRIFWYGWNTLQPSQYAVQEWEKEQEQNLMYIAVTRAKNTLVKVNIAKKEKHFKTYDAPRDSMIEHDLWDSLARDKYDA